jgi:cyclophilin family peptidyl-prolyl cis-trans isomerase
MFRRSVLSLPIFRWALLLCLPAFAAGPGHAQSSSGPVYVFHTNLGNISVQLNPSAAPKTVANFLNYVNRGAYTNSIIHRSVPGFIIQGGGYTLIPKPNIVPILTDPPVVNEFQLSNLRGTIAMAEAGKDPNSATCQWFFNEGNNAANLDIQNGGFTVFGKVLDAASLAVMDQIAAVPVPNSFPLLSSYSFLDPLLLFNFDYSFLLQTPLIGYQVGQKVQVSSVVLVYSITPASASHTDLLWTNTNGTAAVWNLSDPNPPATAFNAGPYPNWTPKAIAQGPDGHTRLLWTNTSGQTALWNLADPNPPATAFVAGPFPNWTATALTVGPDNAAHLLWNNTDGHVALWNTTDPNPAATALAEGPYPGWTGVAIGLGSDNHERLLWDNVSGQVAVWNLADANPGATAMMAGPYSGWTAKRLSVGSDNAVHLLWDNVSGQVAVWNLSDANPGATALAYGPYPDWSGQDLSVGADNKGRLLWDNVSGQNSLWNLADANPLATYTLAGPYSGWTAVSVAAAQ